MKKVIAATITLAVILTGCAQESNSADLTVAEFSAKSQEAGVISLDVRTAQEFAEGHLKNAININVESGNFEKEIANLDKTATYAVYCRSGRRSQVAIDRMKAAGFTNLFNLNAGVQEWAAAGLPLVTN